jgi:sarcosine oxidase subunit gamma
MNASMTIPHAVSIAVLPPVARFNLRIAPRDLDGASKAFGVALPAKIGQAAARKDRAAWCLGPDDWLLHAPEAEQTAICADFDSLRATTPHSLTVISDREFTIQISGPRVLELLSCGSSLDLQRMGIGCAKRTLFDTAQIVLIRDAEDSFRIEVWRSFFPHVHDLLLIAQRELASGF